MPGECRAGQCGATSVNPQLGGTRLPGEKDERDWVTRSGPKLPSREGRVNRLSTQLRSGVAGDIAHHPVLELGSSGLGWSVCCMVPS